MTKKGKFILGSSLGIFLFLCLGISYFVGKQVFESSTQIVTNEETQGVSENFWKKYDVNYDKFINTYKIESIDIVSSFDEHTIPGDYIYAAGIESRDHDTVILVHGAGGNRLTNYPLAVYFLENNFNVITYDQRSSGENTAPYTTFGYWEKYDLIDITKNVQESTQDKIVGYWGTSFGGATVGQALGNEEINQYVDFAILDCPVSSMEQMIAAEIENMNTGLLTAYILQCGNMVNRLILGFGYQDSNVIQEIAQSTVPVLIINSESDQITPEHMGKEIFGAIQHSEKELWTVKNSEHAEVWLDHNEEYLAKMDSFLTHYIKKPM